jgi:glyoxylase-like metal-dependent hydrolase (beta-lactamase superfamily II)
MVHSDLFRADLAFVIVVALSAVGVRAESPRFEPLQAASGVDLFRWSDTCNVYVLREGDAAMLVNLGDGSVLEHLGELGVQRIEWILMTDHHREQCQGHPKLNRERTQVAAPEKERDFFEHPNSFRKMKPSVDDPYTVMGSSYLRPPVEPLMIQRGLKARDIFAWRGHEFWCLETAGSSPGSMSYLTKTRSGWLAFSGDVMVAGGRMHNWFDTEWDYGFGLGLYNLIQSVSVLESFDPVILLPSHGSVIRQPKADMHAYDERLRQLAQSYVRGFKVFTFAPADQDKVSRPSVVPHVWQLTKHLFKLRSMWANYQPNFSLLLADSGHALMFDCGCLDSVELDGTLELMKQRLGLKAIDAILISHMHGDHIIGAPHVREKWGAKIWTLDRIADKFERPERFDYAASIPTYGLVDSVHIDRTFRSGETLAWEGYKLTVDWMPGQTKFGCCVHGVIDGRHIAFTGDNIFANPDDSQQDGHEGLVAHNDAILDEGYIYAADYLRRLQPDLIVGGHSYVMDHPKDLIERYRKWALTIRAIYKGLSAEVDYRYMFDPFWVRVEPYRATMAPGGRVDVEVNIRNFLDRQRTYRLAVHCPDGVAAEPTVLEVAIPAAASIRVPLRLKASLQAKQGVWLGALDTAIDDRRFGELFDFVVRIGANQNSNK